MRIALLALWLFSLTLNAGPVSILDAQVRTEAGGWRVSVTLKHDDSGWDHYADRWRVVDAEGAVIAERVLYHPHVDEQPFTRSLGGIKLPSTDDNYYIQAHDSVHGWSKDRYLLILEHD